jgi:hypothetical protein
VGWGLPFALSIAVGQWEEYGAALLLLVVSASAAVVQLIHSKMNLFVRLLVFIAAAILIAYMAFVTWENKGNKPWSAAWVKWTDLPIAPIGIPAPPLRWERKEPPAVKHQSTNRNAPPVIMQELPSVGNLKQRISGLATETMKDPCENGWRSSLCPPNGVRWQELPNDREGSQNWNHQRTIHFYMYIFERVVNIRDECVQLHIRNQKLDETIRSVEMFQAIPEPGGGYRAINPYYIEETARGLTELSTAIN